MKQQNSEKIEGVKFQTKKIKVAVVFHQGKSTAAPGTRMVVRSTEDNPKAKCTRIHHFAGKGGEERALTHHGKWLLEKAAGRITSTQLLQASEHTSSPYHPFR